MRRIVSTFLFSSLSLSLCLSFATPAAAQKCEGAKLLALGKHYDCAIAAQAKAVKTTDDSLSVYVFHPIAATEGELLQ